MHSPPTDARRTSVVQTLGDLDAGINQRADCGQNHCKHTLTSLSVMFRSLCLGFRSPRPLGLILL